MCFKNLWKLHIFKKTGYTQNLHFWPNIGPRFFFKMAEIKNNKNVTRKPLAIGLSKYCQIKSLSLLFFPRKIRLLFALFRLFLARNWLWSKVEGSELKPEIAYFSKTVPGHLPVKKVSFQNFPVLRL